MIYKFKSKASADLIMLKEGAEVLLNLIGQEVRSKGIIEVAQMQFAIETLEAIVHEHRQSNVIDESSYHPSSVPKNEARKENAQKDQVQMDLDPVSIQQRAVPFLKMMKICLKKNQPIVWGV